MVNQCHNIIEAKCFSNFDIIQTLTPLIGKTINADRCFIASISNLNGIKLINILNTWYANEDKKTELHDNLMALNNSTFEDINAYETYSSLITNNIFIMNSSKASALITKKILEVNHIKSSIRCPIFRDNDLVGMIVLDDFNNSERDWLDSMQLLKSIANNINNII